VGYDKDAEGEFSFFQPDGENTFSELIQMLNYLTPGAMIVSFSSILILLYWDKIPFKTLKQIPGSLVVVFISVLMNAFFKVFLPDLYIQPEHLVNLPDFSFQDLSSYIHMPTVEFLQIGLVWKVAFTLAIVASIETLLNIEGVDKIDPHKRRTPPNRELFAQGIGNFFAGLLGGIPITSVIVRSSVNIQSGNETKLSSIFHGIFLMLSVVFLGSILNLIPLAALAAILLLTGYKLAKISLFKEMYASGMNQFIPFVATIIAIIFTDLLIGVFIGLIISMGFIMKSSFTHPFAIERNSFAIGDVYTLDLVDELTFMHKAALKKSLWSIPPQTRLQIDASRTRYLDVDIAEIFKDFQSTYAPEHQIKINISGSKSTIELKNQSEFKNVVGHETQEKLSPDDIIKILKDGNKRFIDNLKFNHHLLQQVNETSENQYPLAIILSCIDSRTSAELIFDLGLGEIFSCRIAGNVLNEDILGSMEFACKIAGTKVIVVLGHTNCGAIKGACNHVEMGNLSNIIKKIEPVISDVKRLNPNISPELFVEAVAEENVKHVMKQIPVQSPILSQMIHFQEIKLVGGVYNIQTGQVQFFE